MGANLFHCSCINRPVNDFNRCTPKLLLLLLNKVSIFFQIGNDTEAAKGTTAKIDTHIDTLKKKLTDLQRNITDNGIFANRVIEESVNIVKNAEKTKEDARQLEEKYNKTRNELDQKLNNVKSTKERANDLFTKALNLVSRITNTQEGIHKLEDSNQRDDLDHLERQLEMLIKKMNDYTSILEGKVVYYKNCLP